MMQRIKTAIAQRFETEILFILSYKKLIQNKYENNQSKQCLECLISLNTTFLATLLFAICNILLTGLISIFFLIDFIFQISDVGKPLCSANIIYKELKLTLYITLKQR